MGISDFGQSYEDKDGVELHVFTFDEFGHARGKLAKMLKANNRAFESV